MPIALTNMDIGTRYALQEDFNNGFVGRDRQVVIQTDDPKGYRPVIMDGQTQGGKSKVALLADLSDYLVKANPTFTGTLSGSNGTFTGTLSLNGDAVATQSDLEELQSQISDRYNNYGVLPADASQNTYVTVQQLQSTSANLADYAGASGQLVFNTDTKKFHVMDGTTVNGSSTLATNAELSSLQSTVSSTYATKSELGNYATTATVNGKINISGSRGDTAGYENTVTGNTVSATGRDCQVASGTITVSNGSSGQAWTKVVKLGSAVTVNLGSSFRWANGEAPEIKVPALLVCHWNNDAGIASVVNGAE